MNTQCTQMRENLVRDLDGELDAAEAKALRAHLDVCADCRREAEELQALRELWEQAPVMESRATDREAIRRAAQQMLLPGPGWITRLRLWLTPTDLVTAGAVAASVVLAVLLTGDSETSGLPPGWSRSSPVLSLAEARARVAGTEIEIDKDLDLIRMSYAGERPPKGRLS